LLLLSASPALGFPAAALSAALILLGAAAAGIRPRELLAGSRPLIVMLALTALLRLIDFSALRSLEFSALFRTGELAGAGRLSAGILISFASGSLFFSVTTMTEIRRSLERAERFLRRPFRRRPGPGPSSPPDGSEAVPRERLSLALALMLAFLPRFFELWENAETAARARGCTGAFRRVTAILPLAAEGMIESAAETAAALEARGVKVS
jgi:biotin transport system permease protein